LVSNYKGGDEKLDEKEYHQIMRRTLEIFGEKVEDIYIKPKF
jgi:hypothetical protein